MTREVRAADDPAIDAPGEPTIDAAGEPMVLLAERAAWLPRIGVALVADVHLGKAATFRRLGVPVPETTTGATLDRLGGLVDGEIVALGKRHAGSSRIADASHASVSSLQAAKVNDDNLTRQP